MTLAEINRQLEQKRGELAALFTEHKKDGEYAFSADQLAEVNRRNDELTELSKKADQARSIAEIEKRNAEAMEQAGRVARPGFSATAAGEQKREDRTERRSLGDLFVESKAFREYSGGKSPVAAYDDFDVKTLFQTSAGFAPEVLRTGRVELTPQQSIRVVDLVPKTETSQAAIKYMEETLNTNAAAEAAEGGAYGEAALQTEEKTSTVRKIAVSLPVTDEQFEDEPRARDYVNHRLEYMLRARLDSQLLVGNGAAPNLRGLLSVVGINTQAKGNDPGPDAIYKAITKVRTVGFADPNAVILHPNDWQDFRLLRTADGLYIWGNPADAGPERIWGLTVVQTTFETEGTGLVGDFANYCELALRRGIEFQVTNSHGTHFTEGKQMIRADFRAAFVCYRPKAFCSVTGL